MTAQTTVLITTRPRTHSRLTFVSLLALGPCDAWVPGEAPLPPWPHGSCKAREAAVAPLAVAAGLAGGPLWSVGAWRARGSRPAAELLDGVVLGAEGGS